MSEKERESGTIKWFNNAKAWGLITRDKGGPDLFVHFNQIKNDGFIQVSEGDKVTYVVRANSRGPQAEEVEVTPWGT